MNQKGRYFVQDFVHFNDRRPYNLRRHLSYITTIAFCAVICNPDGFVLNF